MVAPEKKISVTNSKNDNLVASLFREIFNQYKMVNIATDEFNKNMVSVEKNENGDIYGKAICILCIRKKRKKFEYAVPYKIKKDTNKLYWTGTNFGNHLKNIHAADLKIEKLSVDNAATIHSNKKNSIPSQPDGSLTPTDSLEMEGAHSVRNLLLLFILYIMIYCNFFQSIRLVLMGKMMKQKKCRISKKLQ